MRGAQRASAMRQPPGPTNTLFLQMAVNSSDMSSALVAKDKDMLNALMSQVNERSYWVIIYELLSLFG